MENYYKFCSVCGGKLSSKDGNLSCTRCPFVNYQNPRPTVSAIILHKNKLLLAKRRTKPFKGWWDLPGGFIDKGETPEKALQRELREEMGLTAGIKFFFGVYHGTYPSSRDPFYVLSFVYIVKPKSGDVRVIDKEELSGVQWFPKKELPKKIAFDSNQRVIKDFVKKWR